ncbi:MAG: SRPBCC family protein [Flavobacteriales bacterium]|nr:SRPBCC family protein [Flavobacteriales bacterium]
MAALVFNLKREQHLPIDLDEAWDFFSTPRNLEQMTPKDMGFQVLTTDNLDRMYPGQVIEYKIRPMFNIPVYWMTEITHVRDKSFFVDEQRFGPYAFWHHQHKFETTSQGVLMTDILHFKVPGGFLGKMLLGGFIHRKVQEIFDYRFKYLEKKFG